jgi:zinc/manganese transport system substrate-binding protein
MKKSILLIAALCLLACSPAQAKLRVVATVPELVDIVRRVGGDLVSVDGIARGTEDIHQVVMRPSYVPKLNRADAVVYLGLTLEHSFLPPLLSVAANPRMRADAARTCLGDGCVDCSEGIAVLEKPDNLSRAEGEIHPEGNPHYNLSPANGPAIARNIAAGLSRLDSANAKEYEANLKAYLAELEPKIALWRKWVAPLKGVKAVSVHKDQAYLGQFTGIDFVGTLELKPGIAPTPTHLVDLVKKMKDLGVPLIVREQHFEPKTSEWVSARTGAKVAVVGIMAGAFPGTETFIKIQEKNLRALLSALDKEPAP